VLLAPVFRSTLPEDQRLSIPRLVHDLRHRGRAARETGSIEEIIDIVVREHRPGDLVLIMSNGGFGGIHDRLLRTLGNRRAGETAPENAAT
jgi:UDP-N-acetylmuramate: L-alanyl-gamma-D-glutamyl-meso-diaminopimelate ligase